MKGTIFAILALGSDRDLSSFRPNHLNVILKRLKIGSRIVGGEEAQPHQYPYQVAVFNKYSFSGGSVIDDHTILTAVHCVDKGRYSTVVAGAHNIRKREDSQQKIASSDIVVHPGWDKIRKINNVALIRLPIPLKLNEYVKAIDLYGGDNAFEGEEATVSGWGKNSDSATEIGSVLRYVTGTVITNTECKEFWSSMNNSSICVSGSGGKSACKADYGGPLLYNNNGVKEQIGIFSSATKLCEIGNPSLYSRISFFKDWINKNRSQ